MDQVPEGIYSAGESRPWQDIARLGERELAEDQKGHNGLDFVSTQIRYFLADL